MPFNEKYCVYILKCADNTFYTGITNNLERRLWEHENPENPNSYTASRLPVTLVWSETFDNPKTAIEFEKRIKKWSQAKKKALINGDFEHLPFLSRNKEKRATYDK